MTSQADSVSCFCFVFFLVQNSCRIAGAHFSVHDNLARLKTKKKLPVDSAFTPFPSPIGGPLLHITNSQCPSRKKKFVAACLFGLTDWERFLSPGLYLLIRVWPRRNPLRHCFSPAKHVFVRPSLTDALIVFRWNPIFYRPTRTDEPKHFFAK